MDRQVVYGALCFWWDTIDKVAIVPGGHIPCCPHCGGVLYQVDSEKVWFKSIDAHEEKGYKGYRAFMEWSRGKCFKELDDAYQAYIKETGKKVDLFRG